MKKICCNYNFYKPYDKDHYICIKCGNIIKASSNFICDNIDEFYYLIYKFVKDISSNIIPNEMPCKYLNLLNNDGECIKCGCHHDYHYSLGNQTYSNIINSYISKLIKIPNYKYVKITPIISIDEFMEIAIKYDNDYDTIYNELTKRVIQ